MITTELEFNAKSNVYVLWIYRVKPKENASIGFKVLLGTVQFPFSVSVAALERVKDALSNAWGNEK